MHGRFSTDIAYLSSAAVLYSCLYSCQVAVLMWSAIACSSGICLCCCIYIGLCIAAPNTHSVGTYTRHPTRTVVEACYSPTRTVLANWPCRQLPPTPTVLAHTPATQHAPWWKPATAQHVPCWPAGPAASCPQHPRCWHTHLPPNTHRGGSLLQPNTFRVGPLTLHCQLPHGAAADDRTGKGHGELRIALVLMVRCNASSCRPEQPSLET